MLYILLTNYYTSSILYNSYITLLATFKIHTEKKNWSRVLHGQLDKKANIESIENIEFESTIISIKPHYSKIHLKVSGKLLDSILTL